MLSLGFSLWLDDLYAVAMVCGHGEKVDGSDSGLGFFRPACMEVSCLLKKILGGWRMLA